jgi:hypothetical protein
MEEIMGWQEKKGEDERGDIMRLNSSMRSETY